MKAMRALLLGLFAVVLPRSASSQTVVWIDPISGVDAPTSGSAAQPFLSMTYALTVVPGGPVELRLFAGTYGTANGEVFPISLPPVCTLTAVDPCTAVVHTTPTQMLPDAFRLPAGTVQTRFVGVNVEANGACVRLTPGPGDQSLLSIEDCELRGGFGVVGAPTSAQVGVTIRDSLLLGVNSAVRLSAAASQVDLGVERVLVPFAGFHGFDLVASQSSTITMVGEVLAVHSCQRNGVVADIDAGSSIDVTLRHAVFHDNGFAVPSGAAISEKQPSSATAKWTITNTILWGNRDDVRNHHAGYSLAHSVIEHPVPGTALVSQDPLFLDATRHDYHLTAISPAIDAGIATVVGADTDGDPIPNALAPDIGIDEFYPVHAHLHPPVVRLNEAVDVHLFGPSGDVAFVVLANAVANPTFASGYRLGPPIFPLIALGVVPPSGELELPGASNADAFLVGVSIYGQGGFFGAASSAITWTDNVFPVRFCP